MSETLDPTGKLHQIETIAHESCERFQIPAGIIGLHNDLRKAKLPDGNTLQGKRQHQLRWGAFLLTYACIEGFFNGVLDGPSNRIIPINPDKINKTAKDNHGIDLFTNDWWVRTLVQPKPQSGGQFGEWRVYKGTHELRNYLSDMKSLRDTLSHGGDPTTSTNKSRALWSTTTRNSLRMLGVEGFMQASFDLIEHTILAYGGSCNAFPSWPDLPHNEFQNRKPTMVHR